MAILFFAFASPQSFCPLHLQGSLSFNLHNIWGMGLNVLIWTWCSQFAKFAFLSPLVITGKCLRAHQKCMDKWSNGILKKTELSFVFSPQMLINFSAQRRVLTG